MSNIYIQEPPTDGKVVLVTTLGDLDIELWSKECPKACRNFVQLCMEEFYNGTIFHRVIPNFIAQGGDPTGTGHGGETIYGEPFKNEIHSRLRFVRRGLVATANTGNNDNESQFFFTLGSCPELQNKHTIFGKVAGDTLYNMVKFNDLETDREDRPVYPPKIIRADIISNPFPDIIPRKTESKEKSKDASKKKTKGTKNLKLLSFGEEEEEADEVTAPKFKSKSSHDLANDPTLSSVPAVESQLVVEDIDEKNRERLEHVRSKLKSKTELSEDTTAAQTIDKPAQDEEYENSDDEKKKKAQKKLNSIKEEIKALKRELRGGGEQDDSKKTKMDDDEATEDDGNQILKELHEQRKLYSQRKQSGASKESNREADTLAILKKFQEKLHGIRDSERPNEVPDDSEDVTSNNWMAHTLKFEDATPVLARDANKKGDDWFEISDPRNAINKRRREESKKIMKDKSSRSKSDM